MIHVAAGTIRAGRSAVAPLRLLAGFVLAVTLALGVLQLHDSELTIDVADGVVTLSGSVPARSDARLLEELASRVEGVVSVTSTVTYERDDATAGF